jgi:hypothetical protein
VIDQNRHRQLISTTGADPNDKGRGVPKGFRKLEGFHHHNRLEVHQPGGKGVSRPRSAADLSGQIFFAPEGGDGQGKRSSSRVAGLDEVTDQFGDIGLVVPPSIEDGKKRRRHHEQSERILASGCLPGHRHELGLRVVDATPGSRAMTMIALLSGAMLV